MVHYFEEKPLALPRVAPQPPAVAVEGTGSVRLPAGEAVMLLRDAAGESLRLDWKAARSGEPQDSRLRVLPAGVYTLVTERFVRRAKDGSTWHTSSTAPKGRTLTVVAGEELVLEPATEVRVTRGFEGEMVSMNIQAEGGAGLSLYKNGVRIPIRYELRDAEGVLRHEGKMNYG